VDEFGEGFPASWCFANREDKTLLVNFFSHLKLQAGNICPQWFMSDDAEQYYSAWIATFEGKPNKILCNWHVDRSWRRALASTIEDKEQQVYLRVLMEEMDQPKFVTLLNKAILQMTKPKSLLIILNKHMLHDINSGHFVSEKELGSTHICIPSLFTMY
jgi:hypothetical protein